jgi:hypothetical protein
LHQQRTGATEALPALNTVALVCRRGGAAHRAALLRGRGHRDFCRSLDTGCAGQTYIGARQLGGLLLAR